MVKIRPAAKRRVIDYGWHTCHFYFSYGDYHDPDNPGLGVIQAAIDDLVEPEQGFARHAHAEAEIFTYLVSGKLSHTDNLGNQHTLEPGDIQLMSAGRGIFHSEINPSKTDQTRFIQIFIQPAEPDRSPVYRWMRFGELAPGKLQLIASGAPQNGVLSINQNANIYHAALEPGQALVLQHPAHCLSFLLCVSGAIRIGDTLLQAHDSAELRARDTLYITGEHQARFLLVEMP